MDTGWWNPKDYQDFAERLSAQGVLVPAALTDNQAFEAWMAGERYERGTCGDPDHATCDPAGLRTKLVQIAQGDST